MFKSHIPGTKPRSISTMSGLMRQRSDPLGHSLFSRLRSGASSLSSGGFGHISCHPQLHELAENNAENINLGDVVLTIPSVAPVKYSVNPVKDLLTKQILLLAYNNIQTKDKHNQFVHCTTGRFWES